ncbi:DUF4337 domain-containing protein [bacterium]|nr:MAG: DUF4337 domain-containing protein [bacterium]
MAEEKKEPWLNWLALTTVILAVCATLSTFKGGGYSTRSVLSQTQASDQWAFYQSKSIKGYLYDIQKDKLELEAKVAGDSLSPAAKAEYAKVIDEYAGKIEKYEKEKAEIMAEAKKFEEIKTDAQYHGKFFGVAVIYLQIAILLSSIAALMKRKPLWLLGLLPGAVGVVYFVAGLL